MKKTSYQKLKEENQKLKKEIHILVNERNSPEGIKLHFKYSRPIMTPILFGQRNSLGKGLLDQIEKVNYNPDILNEPLIELRSINR